jgi:hypothetical protein
VWLGSAQGSWGGVQCSVRLKVCSAVRLGGVQCSWGGVLCGMGRVQSIWGMCSLAGAACTSVLLAVCVVAGAAPLLLVETCLQRAAVTSPSPGIGCGCTD